MMAAPADRPRIAGATFHSRQHAEQPAPRIKLADLRGATATASFGADPRHAFPVFEARCYRLASLYDPLLAMNMLQVDPCIAQR
ncbi:MAG: hypothetical protein RMK84_10855 [Oscillochloridaceae bacterium]|nr:hypothetical protein [Chloroflexaceae bacterium]MDW8390612.1 hypothetical protein [Oscillochloridaceae bacterium]